LYPRSSSFRIAVGKNWSLDKRSANPKGGEKGGIINGNEIISSQFGKYYSGFLWDFN
jgi:hypothetical protein